MDVVGNLSISNGTLSGSSVYGKLNAGDDTTLPVELSTFTAAYINSASTLNWTTQSESNNLGWNVYRSETEDFAAGSVQNADLIDGAGTTSEPTDYTFTNPYPAVGGNCYWYWLESVTLSVESEMFGPVCLIIPYGHGNNDGLPFFRPLSMC